MRKRILITILVMLFVALMLPTIYATGDPADTGVITVLLQDSNGRAYSGVYLRLYRVAEVTLLRGTYSFTLTADFAGSGVNLESVISNEEHFKQAGQLAQWARQNSLQPYRQDQLTSNTGTAVFSELPTGWLYLVVQGANTGYVNGYRVTASPSMIPLPYYDRETREVSDVATASLKFGIETRPTPPPRPPRPPTTPPDSEPDDTTVDVPPPPFEPWPPDEPDDKEVELPPPPLADLPQTGLLLWPIQLLTIFGILSSTAGFLLVKQSRKE